MPYNNMTNNYQPSLYIVDANGSTPFQTIQSAINEAIIPNVPCTILIRPGVYTESLVLADGMNLSACTQTIGTGIAGGTSIDQVEIIGEHTPPLNGTIALSNIKFTAPGVTSVLTDAAAGTASIGFFDCIFNVTNGYAANLDNWTGDIIFDGCSDISAADGVIFNSASAAVDILNSQIGTSKNVIVSGVTRIFNSKIFCGMGLGAGTTAQVENSTIEGLIVLFGNAQASIYNSTLVNPAVVPPTGCIYFDATATGLVRVANVVVDGAVGNVFDTDIASTARMSIGEVVYINASAINIIPAAGADTCAAVNFRSYGNVQLPATTASGYGAIYLDSTPFVQSLGTNNTFVGEDAGNLTLTVANASDEVACGYQALHHVTTGQRNTAIGSSALAVTTGSNNVAIGYNAGSALVAAESGNIMIDSVGVIGDATTIRLGTAQDKNYQAGIYQKAVVGLAELVIVDSTGKLGSQALPTQFTWSQVGANGALVVNTGIVNSKAALLSMSLPAVSPINSICKLVGWGATGWKITQAANQQILFGNTNTTLGAGGSLASSDKGDTVALICVVADLVWRVMEGPVGNLTVV